jgi:hypothetical protein
LNKVAQIINCANDRTQDDDYFQTTFLNGEYLMRKLINATIAKKILSERKGMWQPERIKRHQQLDLIHQNACAACRINACPIINIGTE